MLSADERKTKAERILHLMERPANRREAEMARLTRLSDSELDALLRETEEDDEIMRGALAEWRAEAKAMQPAKVSAPPARRRGVPASSTRNEIERVVLEELNCSHAEIAEMAGRALATGLDFDMETFWQMLRAYSGLQAERLKRDVVWLMVNSARGRVPNDVLRAMHRNYSTVLEPNPILEHPTRPSVAQTLDALAQIVHFTAQYDPSAIVYTSSGGKILSDFVGAFLNIGQERRVSLSGMPARLKTAAAGKLLIIDSVSRTGATLTDTVNRLRALNTGGDIKATCLIATFDACERLQALAPVHAPIIAPSRNVKAPWNSHGRYLEEASAHVFGVSEEGAKSVLTVPKDQFLRQYEHSASGSSPLSY